MTHYSSAGRGKFVLRITVSMLFLLSMIAVVVPTITVSAMETAIDVQTTDLIITGVVDGPLTGGIPKAVEVYVLNDITDLSIYGIGFANNGGGTDGQEFTFPAESAAAGEFLYISSEGSTAFYDFFGFEADYVDTDGAINGDDAIELFMNSIVVDIFGDINVDGTGQAWDYLDGWAYRVNETGPDGSTFVVSNWMYSGIDALDGELTNSGAASPFPIGTYSDEPPATLISEFEPNPTGTDPANVSLEITGPPSTAFDLWVISIENDGYDGMVDRAANITGTFDANGFAVASIPDLENPTFTVVLTDAFTGTAGVTDIDALNDGTLDMSAFGEILDAVGVSDATADDTVLYGAALGGADILFNGYTESFLVFRDGTTGDWYNLVSSSGVHVVDAAGTEVSGTDFDTDPTTSDTFNTYGSVNPSYAGSSDTAPTVSSTDPADSATGVALTSNITVNFNEDVTASEGWYDITCTSSSSVTATVSGGPASYTLDPDTDFSNDEVCTVTIDADFVADQDGTVDNMAEDYIFSFTTVPAPQCGNAATLISAVQGSGVLSPLDGSIVTVEGVVVGDFQAAGELYGFFLQEEDADADGDAATSEGVFVYHTGDDVSIGNQVRLTGTVDEYYTSSGGLGSDVTEIKSVTNLELCAESATLPTAASLSLPNASLTALEAVEGMLVSYSETLYVTETYTLGRYGEVSLSGTAPLDNPTNVAEPGAPALAVAEANDLNRILLDDGSTVQNPAAVEHLRVTNDTLRLGDTVTGLTGVIHHAYGLYRIEPVADVTFAPTSVRPETAPNVGGTLTVASFNVLNYFTTIDDSGAICGPSEDMDCRGADTAAEFTRQRDKIITAIVTLDADVIGLMEIENHVTDAALTDLVNGLNAVAGAGTYAAVNTGPIGTDAIKVALIYKPASVNLLGNYAVLDSSVDPLFIDTLNRPALAQTFTEVASGESFTVVVNHLKSKGSSCDSVSDPDTGDGQGNCNITRTNAATAEIDWLATDPTGSGDSDFLIIGDLNAYAMEDPIDAIKAGGFTDLVNNFGGSAQLYSYVFDGELGYLDHALSSSTLLAQVTGTSHWHINSNEPLILDYNTEYGQEALGLYVDDQYRSSDHDAVVIGLSLGSLTTPVLLTPAHGDTVGNMDVTFTWEKVAVADTYTLEVKTIDTNAVVHKAYYSASARCDDTTCSVTLPDSLALVAHKWHVRAWLGSEGSDWSSWNTFDATLDKAELRSPADAAIIYGGRPTFIWYPVTDALSYIIEFYDDADVLINSWQKSPVCEPYCEFRIPDDLGADYGDYKWRIRAKNSGTEGDWSDTRTFSYVQLDRTWLISPADGTATDDTSPTLQWGQITGATYYLLQIRDQSDALVLQMLVSDELYCAGGTCTWDVDPELAVGDYKWHVRAKNGRNFGRWTAYWDLEITTPAP